MGWQEFISDYSIPFQMGSNGENYEIQCPLCEDDHGKHLGVSLKNSAYGCWRSEEHKGRNPTRVIKAILRSSWNEAKVICSEYFDWHHELMAPKDRSGVQPIEPPEEFFEFGFEPKIEKQFHTYLQSRGYDSNQLIKRYHLRYCFTGTHAWRIIIPVIRDKEWYTWIGRAIAPDAEVRYLAANKKTDNVEARPNDFLFDGDNLTGGRLLVLAEGAFDAMKIQSAFIPGVQATALFGQVLTDTQFKLLQSIAPKYERVIIGLDKDAYQHSMLISQRLSWYAENIGSIAPPDKDWGAMETKEIRKVFANA